MPNDPLQQLKEIHLPNGVSMFPLAPIWYVFMVLLLSTTIIFIIWVIHKKRKQRQIASIYKMLDTIETQNSDDILSQTSILIKRVAIMKYAPQKPHTLFGEEWLMFLDATGKTTDFTKGHGRSLLDIYKSQKIEDKEQFFSVIRKWIGAVL
jgi:hypothetical protein